LDVHQKQDTKYVQGHTPRPAYPIRTLRKHKCFVTSLIDIITNISDTATRILTYRNNRYVT
jgi:hypothetical protein